MRLAGRAGWVLAYGTAGLDQLVHDQGRPVLDGGERASRAAGASLLVGTSSVIGGAAGVKAGFVAGGALGGLVGSVVPGVGTAAGAAVGGVVGSGVGQAVGAKVKGWLF